jgi:hypothetical protein
MHFNRITTRRSEIPLQNLKCSFLQWWWLTLKWISVPQLDPESFQMQIHGSPSHKTNASLVHKL